MKSADQNSYEKLVQDILALRTCAEVKIKHQLTAENSRSHAYVNAAHEWESYFSKTLFAKQNFL